MNTGFSRNMQRSAEYNISWWNTYNYVVQHDHAFISTARYKYHNIAMWEIHLWRTVITDDQKLFKSSSDSKERTWENDGGSLVGSQEGNTSIIS